MDQTSRLIVKNIPKHLTNERLQAHFETLNSKLDLSEKHQIEVTDAKICKKGKKSRQFGFVGFKSEEHAKKALEYFHGTYIDTSKIELDYAKKQGDETIPRAWSRHTVGSSAYKLTHAKEERKQRTPLQDVDDGTKATVEEKKRKFKEFLKLMGVKEGKKQVGGGTTWNDNFQSFMETNMLPYQPYASKEEEEADKAQDKEAKTEDAEPKDKKEGEQDGDAEKKDDSAYEHENTRIFVQNLSFKVTHEELQEKFGEYGEIEKIEIPLRKGGKGVALGMAYINFKDQESAITSFATLDKQYYQGRKIHIMPAQVKPPPEEKPEYIPKWKRLENEGLAKESEFQKEKVKILRTNFDDETNWNYLFMNQDTVAKSMAKKLGIEQSQLIDRFDSNVAVKQAQAETIMINQTKDWLKENGIDLEKLQTMPREKCIRSKTVILVKNIPFTVKEKQLRDIFERYGELKRMELSPMNTIAIVEYSNSVQAATAAKMLAYYKINFINPIYLEFAPDVFDTIAKVEGKDESESELDEEKEAEKDEAKKRRQNTVYVKNLNFNTTDEQLEEVFKKCNLKGGKVISAKIVRDKKSKGYGFVEMDTNEACLRAIKKLQNIILDGHALKLSQSQKKESILELEQQAKKDKHLKKRKAQNEMEMADNEEAKSNKLMVKNLAFEATAQDVRELFKQFGAIKKVRLPKKINSQNHRGYGFVEFTSEEEALSAFKQLQNTHLYGRRLVIEWSLSDAADEQQKNKVQKTDE